MPLFAVRMIDNKEAVGFFFVFEDDPENVTLTDMVDAVIDPGQCEYIEIFECAAVTWEGRAPTMGVPIEDQDAVEPHYKALAGGASFQFALDDHVMGRIEEEWQPLVRRAQPGQCVYFVKAGDFIKIGFTSRPIEQRLAALATSTPETLQLLSILPGEPRETEKALHRRFAALHAQREWFRAEEPLLSFASEVGERPDA